MSATLLKDPWHGRLALGYEARAGRTVLARRHHFGPLLVQRSFYPEGSVCHNYLIHPPGGVVGGDLLELDVSLAPDTDVLLTTPAAGKFYRSSGATARQQQSFRVDAGATLEWLPAETILHGGSLVHLDNHFLLAPKARLLAWDVLCLGRPGSGDHFVTGDCVQQIRVERAGVPLLHERLQLVGGDPMLSAPWGLGGFPVIGTFLAAPVPTGLVDEVRPTLPEIAGTRVGLTQPGEVLICRCLGNGAEQVRTVLEAVWSQLRQPVLGRAPQPPRIWKT